MVKMAKGPFMEFLSARVLNAVADAFAEVQIPTPTSKTENMAMLIHSIEFYPGKHAASAPAAGDTVSVHLSKKTKAATLFVDDPDILAQWRAHTTLNAVINQIVEIGEQVQKFDPPILYPKANLYLAITSTGFASVVNCVCRIGYTLEKVSREDFISALVE